MQLAQIEVEGRLGVAARADAQSVMVLLEGDKSYPGTLQALAGLGATLLEQTVELLHDKGKRHAASDVTFLPPMLAPNKIICVGLNYRDHASEAGLAVPTYPTLFARFASSLVGHEQALVRPLCSEQLDYEGELAVVIGRPGRHIPKASALDHVAGYSIFNDASVRDFQMRTTQWTVGKNFDATGAFGPYLVLAKALPPGCAGLQLETRVNGEVLQSASTDQLIFPVAELISLLSQTLTLQPGDVIITGTPAGVGFARKPPRFLKHGDVCEVEIAQLGVLRNVIENEAQS